MSDTALDPTAATSQVELRVRFCETDLMGIVHHASYLAYFELARVEWLRRRGVAYASWAERGLHLPVVEATTRYRSPARFDDVLTVETRLSELRSHSVRFEYRVLRGTYVIAEGATRLACVGADHKLRRIPQEVASVLCAGELGQA